MRDAGGIINWQAGPSADEVGVEHRHAFAEPELWGLLLEPVVELGVAGRPDMHQIPGMEKFMGDLFINAWSCRCEDVCRNADGDGIAMLQRALAVVFEQESVMFIREAFEDIFCRTDDLLNIGDQREGIEVQYRRRRQLSHFMRGAIESEGPPV